MSSIACAQALSAKPEGGVARAGAGRASGRSYLALVKPSIVALVLFTAVVACFAAAQGRPPLGALLILVVSGGLAAGGASALNHYFDRDIDAHMARTRRRPLASGQIRRPGRVLAAGTAMIALGVGLGALASIPLAAFELIGALVYAVVYTRWLKRRTALNIVVGGAAGSAAVLGGWAAVAPELGLVPWLLAGLVFCWTPAHFWSLALVRKMDYERAGVPMLPVVLKDRATAGWILVHIVGTVALSVGLGLAAPLSAVYFVPALAAAAGFLAAGCHLLRRPGALAGWRLFKFSGVYLGLVFAGILVDTLASTL
ncbi:MAG: protoheme IX farnesyltransferase [Chloroflexi bacterium]|nr:protoheme IX farnesyltransferase [Chloroflexota bacterium]